MLRAILFDLDDTLIDWAHFESRWEDLEVGHVRGVFDYICTAPTVEGAFEHYLDEFLRRTRDAWSSARSTLIAPHVGTILMETAAAVGVPDGTLDLKASLTAYAWGRVDGTSVFDDVPDVLPQLAARGLRFGIVTNAFAPMWLRDAELEEHDLLQYFPECRFSAADVGVLKPHPEIFNAALGCLGTTPEETVFVGDNPVADIAGAQAAGMRAVLRVKKPAVPLLSGLVMPDAAINSLHELIPVLDEWFPGW